VVLVATFFVAVFLAAGVFATLALPDPTFAALIIGDRPRFSSA